MTKLIARDLLRMVRPGAVIIAGALWCAPEPMAAQAQVLHVEAAVEQAFTTLDRMDSPTGYRIGIAVPNLSGPLGIDLGYRSISEYLGLSPERCGMDVCTPGPFDAVMRMRSTWLGLSMTRMLNPFVEFSFGGAVTLTWQDTEYGPTSEAGPEAFATSETAGPDLGGAAFATWRFPPILSVLRPFLFARAEWVRSGSCAADASCFGNRYLGSGGVGVYVDVP